MLRRSFLPRTFAKVVGRNEHLAVRSAAESMTTTTNTVGDTNSNGDEERRIHAGDLLGLIDYCGAHTAMRHVFGRGVARQVAALPGGGGGGGGGVAPYDVDSAFTSPTSSSSSSSFAKEQQQQQQQQRSSSVTTVSMAEIVMQSPVMNGDLLQLRGQVVNCGASSLDVHVKVDKIEFPTVPGEKQLVHVADAFTSFVAIGDNLRPVKVVPPVGLLEESCVKMHERARLLTERDRTRVAEEAAIQKLESGMLKSEAARLRADIDRIFREHRRDGGGVLADKTMKLSMTSSALRIDFFFLQGMNNMHGTIFGGELLRKMEHAATECARRFCASRDIFTLAILSTTFHEPVFNTDSCSMRAVVVHVRNSTLEVDVELEVDRKDGRHLTSNCCTFVLCSLTKYGRPRPIPVDLDVSDACTEDLRAHVCSLARYHRIQTLRMKERTLE